MTERALGPWQFASAPAGSIGDVEALAGAGLRWFESQTATTVAAALQALGEWSLEGPARRFDGEDWWWRTRVPPNVEGVLHLPGLATLADVYLNGRLVLTSENMFLAHELAVPLEGAQLVIRFRSLDAALAARRPRPRWRAPMIEHQGLRFFRTTLLGRTPGWSPATAPVGPWRGANLGPSSTSLAPTTRLEGTTGVVELEGEVVRIPNVQRWWPHTHGEPTLYSVTLGGRELRVGFRELEVDQSDGGFRIRVNGAPVFCRGACWTPIDAVSLRASRDQLRQAFEQVRAAGMNMLRVSGTMLYESDDFWDLADEFGVLIWQDLMFANMDYPDELPVEAEVRQELRRWGGRPSLAVVCGNSEVEQQAAMWGAPREHWSPKLFFETIPTLVGETWPGVPYWPSSAHGGAFPHAAEEGTTSYYGVGAYLRPPEDARRAEVRFATECLAFANVPSDRVLERHLPGVRVHHARWKERAPRDLGAGWDFDDVRDHYLSRLFRVDPLALRYVDHERYLALGRVVTGEVMAHAFGEWRRGRSCTAGALVWFLRDLAPGAGWGLIDALGEPKAAYYYCRRALAAVAAHISDEGGNGLSLHLVNDTQELIDDELEVCLWRDGEVLVARASRPVRLNARSTCEIRLNSLFDGFLDLAHAYRFGPAVADLVVVRFARAVAFHFPVGLPNGCETDLGLCAEIASSQDSELELRLRTRRFVQSVAIDYEGFLPDDNYFHLAPGTERLVRLRRVMPNASAQGKVQALNLARALVIRS